MQEIKLSLSVEDTNLVLEGLGHLPFAKVYALVGNIQEQAARSLRPAPAEAPRTAAAVK